MIARLRRRDRPPRVGCEPLERLPSRGSETRGGHTQEAVKRKLQTTSWGALRDNVTPF
jgi:hypothetical protein